MTVSFSLNDSDEHHVVMINLAKLLEVDEIFDNKLVDWEKVIITPG